MCFLEQKKIIHRDISLRNFLVTQKDAEPYFVKISDFGLSRFLEKESYYINSEIAIPVKWSAPETLQRGKYTIKSDVWGFGIMLYVFSLFLHWHWKLVGWYSYELFSRGNKPYYEFTNMETIQKVTSGYRMTPPAEAPITIAKLMLTCWHEDPDSRPSFQVFKFSAACLTGLHSKYLRASRNVFRMTLAMMLLLWLNMKATTMPCDITCHELSNNIQSFKPVDVATLSLNCEHYARNMWNGTVPPCRNKN